MQPYQKPFLSIRQQIEHLETKGLRCDDHALAAESLQDLGYYRLTAYTYPFRRLLDAAEPRDTPLQFRADEYISGARLSQGVALAKFDAGLREKVFGGISVLELSLRFQLAHVLGRRDRFGHTDRAFLDARACDSLPPTSLRHKFATEFDYWLDSYHRLIDRASSEDFIQHARAKYSSEVPIWVAVETFDFGGLVRLYGLLARSDQNAIAKRFGVSDGRLFHRWLIGLGVVRNHCAHHNRLWNRRLSTKLAAVPPATVTSRLHHLSAVTERSKIYCWIALLSYVLRSYDDTSNWHRTLRTQMSKFPANLLVTPEGDMGFPQRWLAEDLWASAPASVRTLPTPVG